MLIELSWVGSGLYIAIFCYHVCTSGCVLCARHVAGARALQRDPLGFRAPGVSRCAHFRAEERYKFASRAVVLAIP